MAGVAQTQTRIQIHLWGATADTFDKWVVQQLMPKGVKFPWGNFDGCQWNATPLPPLATPPLQTLLISVKQCWITWRVRAAAASQISTSNWLFDWQLREIARRGLSEFYGHAKSQRVLCNFRTEEKEERGEKFAILFFVCFIVFFLSLPLPNCFAAFAVCKLFSLQMCILITRRAQKFRRLCGWILISN